MKVYEIINERVSSVLFHVIDFEGAAGMLEQDKLRQQDVSFARSLTGEYHLGNKMIGVVFHFDGDLLNQRFKGGPVGTEDWDLDDNLTHRGKENKQQEDRLNTKDGLTEVTQYIKAAVMFCPKEFVENSSRDEFEIVYADSVRYIASVEKLLTAKKIPFRYVSSVKELFNKNVNNKQGFLEAVAIVDEDIAQSLGLEGQEQQYDVELMYSEVDADGYSDPDTRQVEVIKATAKSHDAAVQKGEEIASKRNDEIEDKYGSDSPGYWSFNFAEEAD